MHADKITIKIYYLKFVSKSTPLKFLNPLIQIFNKFMIILYVWYRLEPILFLFLGVLEIPVET